MNPGAGQLCSESEAKIPRCPRGASVNHFLVSVSNTSTNYEDCKRESNSFTVGRPLEVSQHYYPIVWAVTQAGGGLLEGAKCVDACRVLRLPPPQRSCILEFSFYFPIQKKKKNPLWLGGSQHFFFLMERVWGHTRLCFCKAALFLQSTRD